MMAVHVLLVFVTGVNQSQLLGKGSKTKFKIALLNLVCVPFIVPGASRRLYLRRFG